MSQLVLRPYQQECIDEHFSYFDRRSGNPLFVVPTGGGKSLIISEFLKVIFSTWEGQKVLILAHVKELIQQNYDEFCLHWGLLAPVGIYSAGLNRRDTQDSAIFAGIQSVVNRAAEFGKIDLLLIDECHLVPKKGQGRYRSFIEECRRINPNVKVIGYTATPYRLDGGYLHEGEGRIFTDIAYEVFLEPLIDSRYLVPLVAKKTEGSIDTSGVGVTSGDFKPGELEHAAMASGCVKAAVRDFVTKARTSNRKNWLIFGCGVRHAAEIVEELEEQFGIHAQKILGTTPKEERETIIRSARAGRINQIVNVGVLTTGFNWPRCDMLALLRPTQSVSLYVQMMGRGMRPFEDKDDCLVLDYGNNIMRHGPINRVRVKGVNREDSDDDGLPRARVCPKCEEILALDEQVCPVCGYEFPIRIAEHEEKASEESPIDFSPPDFTPPPPPEMYDVDAVYFEFHESKGGSYSLKVSYQCGMRVFQEWVCLEHDGFARAKAAKWWMEHAEFPVPPTVEEALERESTIRLPKTITVREEGKYDRIINRSFPIAGLEEEVTRGSDVPF